MPKEQMTIRLYPETRRRMDSWLEESNSKNRNEFVEKALRFYMGYLGAEDITGCIGSNAARDNRGQRQPHQQSPVQVRGRARHYGSYHCRPLP